MGMSIRAYAIRRGVSHTAVRKALSSGRITAEPDGTLDPDKCDAAWAANTNQAQTRKPPDQGSIAGNPSEQGPDYQKARAIKEAFQAKLAQQEYQKRARELVKADEVRQATARSFGLVRDRMRAIPFRLGPVLAVTTEASEIVRLLKQEIDDALNGVADEIVNDDA
ncbi:MAG: hypothetical protein HQL56_01115 [Magnetococcales bacterium]|nr:hypothetical protein [Magnetococcales bacterium]